MSRSQGAIWVARYCGWVERSRDPLLTLAFHGEHRPVYDAIAQAGAPDTFTVACVRTLLERGCVGSRHALSLLLEVARSEAGDEKAADRQPLVAVVGVSGSGKSSVVQAGLLPVLRRRGGWSVAIVRPGPEPWRSLAGCLLEQIEGEPATGERVRRQLAVGELARGVAGGARVGLSHLIANALVVLTLRADFFGRALDHRPLRDHL